MPGLLETSVFAPELSVPHVVGSVKLFRIQRHADGKNQWLTYQNIEGHERHAWTTNESDAMSFRPDDQLTMELCLDMAMTIDLPRI